MSMGIVGTSLVLQVASPCPSCAEAAPGGSFRGSMLAGGRGKVLGGQAGHRQHVGGSPSILQAGPIPAQLGASSP